MRYAEDYAQDGSKTRRKQLRRAIRTWLGTSSDEAPTVYSALHAANELRGLLDIASSGRFGLAVYDFATKSERPISEALTILRDSQQLGVGFLSEPHDRTKVYTRWDGVQFRYNGREWVELEAAPTTGPGTRCECGAGWDDETGGYRCAR